MTTPTTVAALTELATEPELSPRCPTCSGRGYFGPDPDDGSTITCPTCDGSGRGSAWLPTHYRPLRVLHVDNDDGDAYVSVDEADSPRNDTMLVEEYLDVPGWWVDPRTQFDMKVTGAFVAGGPSRPEDFGSFDDVIAPTRMVKV